MADGDQNTVGALPTQLPPQAMQNLLGGGGSPLGPTSPVDPQQVAAQMMQRGGELTEQQLKIANPAAAQATSLASAPYKTNDPVYGTWSGRAPGAGTPTPQPGFLHTIGRALMALAEATTPGQTIMNQRYASQTSARGAEAGERAEQISALQKQATLAEEPIGATARMGPAYMGAAAREQTAQATSERATAYVQSIKDRAQNYAATQDWHAATLDEKKRDNIVREIQAKANTEAANFRSLHKDATSEEVAGIMSGTRQAIADEAAARDPSVKSWLFGALGIGVPQIPTGQNPEMRPITPTPTKPTAKPKGGTLHYDKNGNRVQGPS